MPETPTTPAEEPTPECGGDSVGPHVNCETSGHLYAPHPDYYRCVVCGVVSAHADHSAGIVPAPSAPSRETTQREEPRRGNPLCECGEPRCKHFGRAEYCTPRGLHDGEGATYRFSGRHEAPPATTQREEWVVQAAGNPDTPLTTKRRTWEEAADAARYFAARGFAVEIVHNVTTSRVVEGPTDG